MKNRTVGILMYESVNELDFLGPYEVFANSDYIVRVPLFPPHVAIDPLQVDVRLIGKTRGTVTCEKGLRVEVPYPIDDCDNLDVLVVPGGSGVDAVSADAEVLAWIRRVARGCEWTTSVCNGLFILTAAGLTADKKVTTHWAALDALRGTGATGPVLEDVQFVRDGPLVSSAGVSAGIDMALWVIGQITTPARARLIQRTMQYDPAPPYTAEV